MARSTVREALKRAESAGLSWPLPEGLNDDALEASLYANRRSKRGHRRVEEPDWAGVHRELQRKHVTLTILWDEYIAENPGGYRYSRFCQLYRAFAKYAVGDDAANLCRRRAAFRRLTPATACQWSSTVSPARSAWRRFSSPFWGVELHIRQGELDAGAPRLDRRPCKRPSRDRRRSPAHCPG